MNPGKLASAVLTSLLLGSPTYAGMVTTASSNAISLANQLLAGKAVVTNATLAGDGQVGSFTDAVSPLFFSSGIYLSTGADPCIAGPNDQSACTGGEATFSELVIEFVPLPGVTTVEFRYVFGSDEFPEYVEADFQDSLRIALNGDNLAILNNGENVRIQELWLSDDYVANHGFVNLLGKVRGVAAIDDRTQFDGFSKALLFSGGLRPGTNTLQIRIADANDTGDTMVDSAVLIEAAHGGSGGGPAVPEPATLLLTGAGLLAAAAVKRGRIARSKNKPAE